MTVLVTWIWQGLAIALAASLGMRACRRLDAASRHALWWGVLAAIVAQPWIGRAAALVRVDAPHPPSAGDVAAVADALPALVVPTPPDWLVAVAVGAWLGTVILGLVRTALGCAFALRVRRTARPLAADRAKRLALWTAAGEPRRPIAILVSPQVRTACAVGWGRPAIVLPPTLLDALDDDALDQIVMHERAHLERGDDVWRVVEALIESVAGLHPGVRLALHHVDLEREAACDDRVVLATGRADRYAACLADAAATACAARFAPALIPSAVRGASVLQARVGRLLDRARVRRIRLRPVVVAVGCASLMVVSAASAQLDALVVFKRPLEAAAAARMPSFPSVMPSFTPAMPPVPTLPAGPAGIAVREAFGSRVRRDVEPAPSTAAAAAEPGQERADVRPAALPSLPLASRALEITIQLPDAPAARPYERPHDGPVTPWAAAVDGGAAIGSAAGRSGAAVGAGAKKASTAVAGFFARTGRKVGSSF